LDCGGKRSATPLSHTRSSSAKRRARARPKAPSPLRSAGALHDNLAPSANRNDIPPAQLHRASGRTDLGGMACEAGDVLTEFAPGGKKVVKPIGIQIFSGAGVAALAAPNLAAMAALSEARV